jgi:phage tail protein X
MKITTYQDEKSMAELAARVFPTSSRAPAKRKQVTDALLSANPQLADLSKVQRGAKIVVPETVLPPDPAQVTTMTPSTPTGRNTLVLYRHLESLKTAVPAAAATAVANANATITLMQRVEVQAAAAKNPRLAKQVASVTQRANAKIQAAQTLQAKFLQSIGPLQATLMKLAQP